MLSPSQLDRMPTTREEGRLSVLRRARLDIGEGIPGMFGALYLDSIRADLQALVLVHNAINGSRKGYAGFLEEGKSKKIFSKV